ncbi:hypothetical protein F5B17DRAFT_319467, partial [Nemania serpens]
MTRFVVKRFAWSLAAQNRLTRPGATPASSQASTRAEQPPRKSLAYKQTQSRFFTFLATKWPCHNKRKIPFPSSHLKIRLILLNPSLYNSGGDMWENRIYSCLVISPAGRVINDFRTINELLAAIRDAIKAHQSLYETGNILHRDISSNNIIITEPEMAGGFNGMLIDLDLAKIRDSGPSGARHQTGTMQFMAVEVLRKTDHTYRHDLESFFYV